MGKNLIIEPKNISSIFKQFLSDECYSFVFPTDVVMNSWIDWCVMNPEESGVSAVPLERFIAWDKFKSQFMSGEEENKTSIPALLRKLFVNNLLIKNKDELFLKKIISKEFANNYASFSDWVSKFLPSLKLWTSLKFLGMELSFENQDELNKNLDEEDQDFLSLYLHYSDFLEKNNMFEPAWIKPDFSSVGKKFVIIYPELLEDYADFVDVFAKTEDFVIVNMPSIEANSKGPECLAFSDSRKELRRVILKIRELVETGIADWTEIALNVPDLDTYRPYIEREFKKYCVPYVIRAGNSLTNCCAGSIFPQISQCYNSDFSYDSVRELLLNVYIPWKNSIKVTKENLIREGQEMHCICGYSDSDSDFVNDTWLEALNKTADTNSLELNLYKSLKKDIKTICEASSFENLQKAWLIFKENFLETSQFTKTANNILSTCINHLNDIIQIEKDYLEPLAISVEKPFDFFLSEIKAKTYTPQTKKVGVNVYKYKLAAAANIKYQFVIDASQKNLEIPYKRLDFLGTEKRKVLGLEKEDKMFNVSKLFIQLYATNDCCFSYAEDSFSGFAIAHNYFSVWNAKNDNEKENGPLYELDKKDFILNEEKFIVRKSDDFSSIRSLSENQKNQYEVWFTKKQNSKKLQDEDSKKSAEKIENLIWEYLTVNKHSDLPSITQSDLKNFFPCPRNWIFKSILKLKEDSLDAQLMDNFTMGNINHKVLELFLKWCISENKRRIPCSDEKGEFSEDNQKLIGGLLYDFIDKTILEDYKMDFHNAPLTKLCLISQKKEIATVLFNFLKEFCKPLAQGGFGNSTVAYSEEWKTSENTLNNEILEVTASDNKQWAFSGKIDCVITDENDETYIVDFKTGSTPAIKKCIVNDDGELEDFQIPQYITLLNSDDKSLNVENALFYSINDATKTIIVEPVEKRKPRAGSVPMEEYQKTIEIFFDYAKQFISKVENEDLEPHENNNDIYNNVNPYTTCIECNFKQICRSTYSIK